ncbi:MAG TPA: hypothetical protein VF877_03265 [Gaiellaceae bacterium]
MIRTPAATDDEAAPLDDQASPWPVFGTGLRGRVAGGHGESPQSESGAAAQARHEDPISPELVLIDPELGQRARELLPVDRPSPTRPAERAADTTVQQGAEPVDAGGLPTAVSAAAPQPEPSPAPEPARPHGTTGRRRRWVSAVSSVVVLGALAALGWMLAFEWPGPDAKRDARVEAERPVTRSVSVSTTPAGEGTKEPRAPTGPRPMTFGWVPVRNTSVYLVAFFQGPRKIFEARTGQTRVTVPAHWTYGGHRQSLTPGRYHWTVRPGLGAPASGRFGQPVVRATLVVRPNAT